MPIRADSLSRFRGTDPVIKDGSETYGRWARPEFLDPTLVNESDIVTISIDQRLAGRPDLIAIEQYGIQQLEWVVVMFNRPLNTLGWPQVGTVIKLPRKNIVTRSV